jgi:hypothetical protein
MASKISPNFGLTSPLKSNNHDKLVFMCFLLLQIPIE